MVFGRVNLPGDVRRALSLTRGEKVLAAARLADGGWSVATTARLAVVPDDRGMEDVRPTTLRPWCDVHRASFDAERSVLTVEWVDATPDLELPITDPERTSFPQALRERVQWSVVLAETVRLPHGREAQVAVRRTTDGELFSQSIAGPGVDLDDPAVAPAVDAAEARVRGAAGL